VQGRLRQEPLTVTIATTCAHGERAAHSERALQFDLDSDLRYSGGDPDAAPLVFVPMVNFGQLDDPSIIDAF